MSDFDFNSSEPFEIIAAPCRLYLAPVGTAFPMVDETPDSSAWALVGSAGELNADRQGVTLQHSQELLKFRSLGDTGPRKAVRPNEDFMITARFADFRAEMYSIILNHNTVTTVPATATDAGYKWLGLSRGPGVVSRALLVRGLFSPYGAGWTCQWEIPIAVLEGNPAPVLNITEFAIWEMQFSSMVDADAVDPTRRFGRWLVQHEAATS